MNPTYHGSNYLPYQPPPPPPQPPLPATNSTSNTIATTTNQSTYPTTSYQYYNNALPSISDTGSTHGISQEPTLADYNAYQGYDGYYDYYEGYGEEEYYEDDGKQKHYHCEICNVMCSGYDNYFAHLSGKIHKRKQAVLIEAAQNKFNTNSRNAFRCVICNVDCSSEEIYQTHVNGQKHQKVIKGLIRENKPIPVVEGIQSVPPKNVGPKKRKDISEVFVDTTNPFGSENDEHMVEKLDQISLNKVQKNSIEQLVLLIEDTLFNVSRIIEEQQVANSVSGTTNSSNRLLRGIMRTGLLANDLLLKNDRRAHLIVLCSSIPTTDMLSQVTELFTHYVKKGEQTLTHKGKISVEENVREAGFSVSQAGIPMYICVSFTCSVIRQWSPGDLNYYSYNIPQNALPQDACLQALAEMRRTKFYQVKCSQYEWMTGVVKIVREFSNRIPAWSPLSDWVIILIVEKVFSSNTSEQQPGPSGALKALFKAISEEIILSPGSQLLDPCEKLPTDVLVSITPLERQQLFASARYSLRQINGNKMAKLLALEGPGVPSEVVFPAKKRAKKMGMNNDQPPDLSANDRGMAAERGRGGMGMSTPGIGRGMPPGNGRGLPPGHGRGMPASGRGRVASGGNAEAIGTRSMRVYDNF
uniref:DZF domain-containing protein n=2 Tax=Meloidogyne TaxID=189290 RepID=A0A914MR10_MELIC